MPFLDLICLANARKRSERCVAGLRADAGGWIRLVSRAEHGEFTYAQRNLGEAGEPQNFDLICVELVAPRSTPGQPENCLVGNAPWKLLQRPASSRMWPILASQLGTEDVIFGSGSDRLAVTSFHSNPVSASLALVKPQRVRFLHEVIGSKKRARALFALGQNCFNLAVTDPPFEQKLKGLPAGYPSLSDLGIADERKMLFCMSLGEPFEDGNCYKLVAGVLLLPSTWALPQLT